MILGLSKTTERYQLERLTKAVLIGLICDCPNNRFYRPPLRKQTKEWLLDLCMVLVRELRYETVGMIKNDLQMDDHGLVVRLERIEEKYSTETGATEAERQEAQEIVEQIFG